MYNKPSMVRTQKPYLTRRQIPYNTFFCVYNLYKHAMLLKPTTNNPDICKVRYTYIVSKTFPSNEKHKKMCCLSFALKSIFLRFFFYFVVVFFSEHIIWSLLKKSDICEDKLTLYIFNYFCVWKKENILNDLRIIFFFR